MVEPYKITFLETIREYIDALTDFEQQKVAASVRVMANGDFQSVYIKQIRKDIKELKINKHRFLFFIQNHTLYFIKAFLKKTLKTPKREIDYVERIYKIITSSQ